MRFGTVRKFAGLIVLSAGASTVSAQIENSPAQAYAARTDVEIRQAAVGRSDGELRQFCDALLNEIESAASRKDFTNRARLARVVVDESRRINYREGELRALRQISSVHFDELKPELGIEVLKQAIDLAAAIGDHKAEWELLNGLGYSYNQQGDYTSSLDAYIRLRGVETGSGSPASALTLNAIGALYMRLGDYNSAEAAHREALAAAEKSNDKDAIASAYFHIGIVSRSRGNYADALKFYHQSRELTDTLVRKDPNVYPSASTRRHISGTYFLQGNLRLAMEYVNQALALDERRGDSAGSAYSLQMIAMIRTAQKDFHVALPIVEKTVPMFEKVGDADGLARSLTLLGNIYLSTGEYSKALEILHRPLRMREMGGNRDGVATVRIAIAKALTAENKYVEALESAEKAAAAVRETGNRELLWQAQSVVGQIHLARNECDKAREALDSAIETIESLRNEVVGGAAENSLFFAERVKPYQLLAAMFAAQGNFAESFEYTERAKARGLLDSLRIGRGHQGATMTEREKLEENSLRSDVTSLNTRIARLAIEKNGDGAKTKDLNEKLYAARTALTRFQTDLYATHPELRINRSVGNTLQIQEAAALIDRDSALVEYAVADDAVLLYVFTKSPDGVLEFKTYRSPIKRGELARDVSQFRLALADRNLLFSKSARRLYDLLIRPAERQLKGKSSLTLVPDDGLWELPFQALQSAENKYLLDDASVSYVPSLTILRELRGAARRPNSGLLAFVNPADLSRGARGGLPDLPAADRQSVELKSLLASSNSRIYKRGEAGEGTFKMEVARGASILHLATHGVLDSSSPLNSYVVLAPEPAKGEDGRLEAGEILELNLNADLVTLSACETARGETRLGEGLIGLAWSFMNAGARSVVVSQWKVESESTAGLTTEFYKNLKRSDSRKKAEALRQASLLLRRNPRTGHPFYWAGFVLIGGAD